MAKVTFDPSRDSYKLLIELAELQETTRSLARDLEEWDYSDADRKQAKILMNLFVGVEEELVLFVKDYLKKGFIQDENQVTEWVNESKKMRNKYLKIFG